MGRLVWNRVAGVGTAALLAAAPAALAGGQASGAPGEERSGTPEARRDAGEARKGGASGPDRAGRTSTSGSVDSSGAATSMSTEGSGSAAAGGGPADRSTAEATGSGGGAGREVRGRLESYDRQSGTLRIAGSEKKLRITRQTKVTRGGSKADARQLKVGDEVRARLAARGAGGAAEVLALDISPPAERSGSASQGAGGEQGTGSATAAPPASEDSPRRP